MDIVVTLGRSGGGEVCEGLVVSDALWDKVSEGWEVFSVRALVPAEFERVGKRFGMLGVSRL